MNVTQWYCTFNSVVLHMFKSTIIGFIYYQYTKISHTNQTTDVKLKCLNNKFPFYSIVFSFTYLGRKKISPTSHGKDKFNRGNCKLIKDTNRNIAYGCAIVSILAFKRRDLFPSKVKQNFINVSRGAKQKMKASNITWNL